MPRPAPDLETVRLAREAVGCGISLRAVARQFGVSAPTISRWLKMTDAELAPDPGEADRVAAQAAIAGHVEGVEAEERDLAAEAVARYAGKTTREALKLMIADTIKLSAEAQQTGNTTTAQRCMRDVGNLTTTLARIERAEREDGDALRIPREELKGARDRVLDRIRALAARPLLCAHCGRRLSVSMAGLDPDAGETMGEGVK